MFARSSRDVDSATGLGSSSMPQRALRPPTPDDAGELPRQVVDVRQAAVQAQATVRGDDVRRVAGHEHASASEAIGDLLDADQVLRSRSRMGTSAVPTARRTISTHSLSSSARVAGASRTMFSSHRRWLSTATNAPCTPALETK
jgi:hypothetical protein